MDKELKELFDNLHRSFEQMRATHKEEITALEKKIQPDPLLVKKLEAQNTEITSITAKITEVQERLRQAETAQARLAPVGSPEQMERETKMVQRFFAMTQNRPRTVEVTDADRKAYRAYSAAFVEFLRVGPATSPEIKAALQTGVGPDGGLFVTPDTSGRIVELIRLTSPVREIATVQAIGTDELEGTYDNDEADSGWVGETSSRPETNTPKVGAYKIPVFEQYANPKATQKQLDDSDFDVEGWLARKVSGKFARRENTAFVLGLGIVHPRGFTTYPAGTPSATTFNVVRQIASGASGGFPTPSATVNPADAFLDMVTALKAPYRAGARFVGNSVAMAAARKLRDTQGRYLLIPDFSQGPSGTILGYPVTELEDMAAFAADSLSFGFGNWKEAYTILDHTVGMRVLRDPFTAKPWVHFYTTKRVGGDVVNFEAFNLMKMNT